jgi:hypothetical protein
MVSNLDRYKKDLDFLIDQGELLFLAIQKECAPQEFDKQVRQHYKDEADEFITKIPSFNDIKVMVQAGLFDSDLDAAGELAKNKFTRAAGASAGVVLERHLAQGGRKPRHQNHEEVTRHF